MRVSWKKNHDEHERDEDQDGGNDERQLERRAAPHHRGVAQEPGDQGAGDEPQRRGGDDLAHIPGAFVVVPADIDQRGLGDRLVAGSEARDGPPHQQEDVAGCLDGDHGEDVSGQRAYQADHDAVLAADVVGELRDVGRAEEPENVKRPEAQTVRRQKPIEPELLAGHRPIAINMPRAAGPARSAREGVRDRSASGDHRHQAQALVRELVEKTDPSARPHLARKRPSSGLRPALHSRRK